jgi:hypothetical protein
VTYKTFLKDDGFLSLGPISLVGTYGRNEKTDAGEMFKVRSFIICMLSEC